VPPPAEAPGASSVAARAAGALRRLLGALEMSSTRFFVEFQKDLKLWLFCVAFMEAWRFLFMFIYRGHMGDSAGLLAVLASALNGARYDSKVAALWMAPSFLASLACAWADLRRAAAAARLAAGTAFVACSAVLFRVALGYYEEYRNNFDHWLFGMYYDDAGAVMGTVSAQYNLPLNIVIALALTVALALALRRLLRRPFVREELVARWLRTLPRRIAAGVAVAAFVFVASSGSIGKRPLQLKDAAVTTDEFLNKAVVNPYMALYYAVSEHRRLSRSDGLGVYLPDGDIASAARLVFGRDGPVEDLDSCMLRRAKGPKGPVPRHVFVIVMESYDAWPLLPAYAPLGLSERLKALAREGIAILNFLSGSDGTMTSYAALVTGLPDAGVHTNYRETAESPYPSSVPETFRRLGYRTRLFYSGYLSWQRIDQFSRAQGFDEAYGGAHMGSWAVTNEWGVRDSDLFTFAGSMADDSRPTFDLLLTTSNHPPYTVDVWAEGFPLQEIPESVRRLCDGTTTLRELGHLWYSDKCLGEFVEKMERELPLSLFAITGDHFSRKHVSARPGLWERSCVPLVLYGRDVLRDVTAPDGVAGSHIDIGPTLVELAAPRGFEYYSLGRDLLRARGKPGAAPSPAEGGRAHQTARPAAEYWLARLGVGRRRVVTADFVVDASDPPSAQPAPGGSGAVPAPAELAELKRFHDCLHAVAWWRIMKGNLIRPVDVR